MQAPFEALRYAQIAASCGRRVRFPITIKGELFATSQRVMLIEAPFNETTGEIIAAAIEVHRALGPGLLESTYSECLQMELAMRKLRYVTQHTLPIVYKGRTLDTSYRVDLIVEDCVVVEVKSVATMIRSLRPLRFLPLTSVPLRELRSFSQNALAAP